MATIAILTLAPGTDQSAFVGLSQEDRDDFDYRSRSGADLLLTHFQKLAIEHPQTDAFYFRFDDKRGHCVDGRYDTAAQILQVNISPPSTHPGRTHYAFEVSTRLTVHYNGVKYWWPRMKIYRTGSAKLPLHGLSHEQYICRASWPALLSGIASCPTHSRWECDQLILGMSQALTDVQAHLQKAPRLTTRDLLSREVADRHDAILRAMELRVLRFADPQKWPHDLKLRDELNQTLNQLLVQLRPLVTKVNAHLQKLHEKDD